MSLNLFALILVVCFFGMSASAQLSPPKSLTLDECFDLALKRSEVIAGQEQLILQAEERYKQAVGSVLPSVSAGYNYTRQPLPKNPLASSFSPEDQQTLRLSATQPLFRGFREFETLKQRKLQRELQTTTREQAVVQLYNDMAQAFYNVLALQSDVANFENEISVDNKRLGDLRVFKRSGRSRAGDLLLTEAAIATLEAQLELARGQLAAAREVAAFLTGIPAAQLMLQDSGPPPSDFKNVERFLSGIDRRPDVIAAKADWDATKLSVSIAHGAHLPSVDLVGDYYLQRPGVFSDINWDIQIVATLPLFSGGVIQSQVREAASQTLAKELTYTRARRQAEEEIRSLFATVTGDSLQTEKLTKAADLTNRSYQVEQRDYKAGLATNVDVLQASAAAEQTKRALDRAKSLMKLDYAKLLAAAAEKPRPSPPKGQP